jgi:hypothetical protein
MTFGTLHAQAAAADFGGAGMGASRGPGFGIGIGGRPGIRVSQGSDYAFSYGCALASAMPRE